MNVDDLIDLLSQARDINCFDVQAKTPHGTYTFNITDVEAGLSTGSVTLRLEEVTA